MTNEGLSAGVAIRQLYAASRPRSPGARTACRACSRAVGDSFLVTQALCMPIRGPSVEGRVLRDMRPATDADAIYGYSFGSSWQPPARRYLSNPSILGAIF